MNKIKFLPALLLTLLLAVAGTALLPSAQAMAASSTTKTATTKADPCNTDAKPTIANPTAVKTCANGQIEMQVSSPRDYGYRVGDVIPIQVVIVTAPNVLIDFSTLENGSLGVSGSQFQVAADDPVTINKKVKGEGIEYTIDLNVQSFVPVPASSGLVFELALQYSTGFTAGQGASVEVLTTPLFVVTTGTTLDNGTTVKPGTVNAVPNPLPWPTWPLLAVGLLLVLFWPGRRLLFWLNRVRPFRKPRPNEVAWRQFDRTFADGNEHGFSEKHYRQIASTLKRFYKVEQLSLDETRKVLSTNDQLATINSALELCDKALYTQAGLLDDEREALVAQIELIVPRPRH